MGRRIRPPFTPETFAVTITALVQGLSLRVTIEPDAVPQDLRGLPGACTEQAAVAQPHGAAHAGTGTCEPQNTGEGKGTCDGKGTCEHTWDLFSAVTWTLLTSMSEPITGE
jgi:hypothetical protein